MREEATLYAARCSSALAIACATVLPLQRRRGRCVTICIYVHAGERAQMKTSPLKAISARPTSSRWRWRRERHAGAAPRAGAGGGVSQVFTPFLRKAQTSAAFVYSLCAPIRIKFVLLFHSPFLLRTSSLAEERVAGFQDVEQRER